MWVLSRPSSVGLCRRGGSGGDMRKFRGLNGAATSTSSTALNKRPLRVCSGVLFFQARGGIRDLTVTGVQTCALPISLQIAGAKRRDDWYWTMSAVLLSRQEQRPIFDQAFQIFWRDPKMAERMMQLLVPKAHGRSEGRRVGKEGRYRGSPYH